jgi:hypothetical protein
MKRANMLLVCSILVVILACSLVPSGRDEPKHYDNGVIAFDYPPDWTVSIFEAPRSDPIMGADEILQINLEKSSAAMHILRRRSNPGESLQDLAEGTYAGWDGLQVPWEPESGASLQVNDNLTYEKIYRRPWGEPWNRFRDVWFQAGDQIYILSCTATQSNFENYQDECDLIVRSFEANEGNGKSISSPGPTETPGEVLPPPTSAPAEKIQLTTALLPPGASCRFQSDGNPISGWYWLRDQTYSSYGEWHCTGLPQGADTAITLLALVTNQGSGGSGYSTPAKLTITNPSTEEAEGVQIYLQNPLPEQNPANSGGQGYLSSAYLVLPANYIGSDGSLQIRIERLSPNPYHIAVNSDSLRAIPPRKPDAAEIQGDWISGWYWLRDAENKSLGDWRFSGLAPNATLSILTLDTLVTQGADGGSGYSMPVQVVLTNPSTEEQLAMDYVQVQNLLFGANPENSAGHGYQTYGSILFDSRLIGEDGSLVVRIKRPSGAEYHLAVNENSPGVVQFGGQRPDVVGGTGNLPTPEKPTDQAACEAQGGKWGPIGLYPQEVCNLPTTDAGTTCTDSSQCQSACVAELTQQQFDDAFRKGAIIETSGTCAAWQILVGCIPFVEDGKVSIICID